MSYKILELQEFEKKIVETVTHQIFVKDLNLTYKGYWWQLIINECIQKTSLLSLKESYEHNIKDFILTVNRLEKEIRKLIIENDFRIKCVWKYCMNAGIFRSFFNTDITFISEDQFKKLNRYQNLLEEKEKDLSVVEFRKLRRDFPFFFYEGEMIDKIDI